MAWVTPRTFTAAAVLTAAQLNETRDNLKALLPLDAVAWTAYTPSLTQSATVTKTVTRARWNQVGKLINVRLYLAITGSGTANNAVIIGLPTTSANTNTNEVIGTGLIHDVSAALYYPQIAVIATASTFAFVDATAATNTDSGQTGAAFSAALASPDEIMCSLTYEAL